MHDKETTTQNTNRSKQLNHRPENSPFDSPLSLLAKKESTTPKTIPQTPPTPMPLRHSHQSKKAKIKSTKNPTTTPKRLIRPTP
jgi:hypothetical protein